MCQLLGLNSNASTAINFSFTGFSQRGGNTADHVDGWGIAFYENNGSRVFIDDQPASASRLAQFVREYPIKSKTVISHIRKATQGDVSLANCHPFQREWLGQTWIFAHNGDLRNYHPELTGEYLPVGSTDSEKAFCYLMQEMRVAFKNLLRPPHWSELAPVIAKISASIARHGNFNLLLTNGDAVYSHCSSNLYSLNREHPFPNVRLVDCDISMDLSALNHATDRMIIIATEPLTSDELWKAYAIGESKVFVDGQELWQSVDKTVRKFPIPQLS
jgi:predicted glutamine amidotransferase